MKIAGKIEAVRFSEALTDDFVLLFNLTLGKRRNIDREKVLKIFGRGQYLGYLAYENKSPVGFYGAIPLDFVYNNKIIHIAQSVNTMVLPAYRKYNLFYHLAELTNTLARKENIDFLYGLPNSPHLFHSLLDWTYLGPMKKYTVAVKTLPFAKIFWKLFWARKLYLIYYNLITCNIRSENTRFSAMKQKTDANFHINRSENYVNYKKKLGTQIFKIDNVMIPVGLDYRMKIGDIEDVTLDSFHSIIKKLKRKCFWLGINEICFSFDPQSEWNHILKPAYTAKDDVQLMYYPLNEQYKLDIAHITLLDYDTF